MWTKIYKHISLISHTRGLTKVVWPHSAPECLGVALGELLIVGIVNTASLVTNAGAGTAVVEAYASSPAVWSAL